VSAGTLFTVGLGPGDPDLMTLKAARVIADARVIAYFAKRGLQGHARTIVTGRIHPEAEELRLEYPFTTEVSLHDPQYADDMAAFYEACAARLAGRLDEGSDIALLCEGDPFFYGSSMYLYDRLRDRYTNRVIPGVCGMSGCWAEAGMPIVHGDDVLTILPATLAEESLRAHLQASDGAVIMKVGRNLEKVRRVLLATGWAERAIYVERGTMEGQRILPLSQVSERTAPYFSLILVPGRQRSR
jgi:precorrin-2/cobalt-factor-2 C20-methyltransferase